MDGPSPSWRFWRRLAVAGACGVFLYDVSVVVSVVWTHFRRRDEKANKRRKKSQKKESCLTDGLKRKTIILRLPLTMIEGLNGGSEAQEFFLDEMEEVGTNNETTGKLSNGF